MWQWGLTQPKYETDAGAEAALWAIATPCICTLLQIDVGKGDGPQDQHIREISAVMPVVQ